MVDDVVVRTSLLPLSKDSHRVNTASFRDLRCVATWAVNLIPSSRPSSSLRCDVSSQPHSVISAI